MWEKIVAIFDKKPIVDILPNKNGIIIISEWLLNDEKTGPIPAALMGLNMMIETSGGRNYSFVEISKMLSDVGFLNIEKTCSFNRTSRNCNMIQEREIEYQKV